MLLVHACCGPCAITVFQTLLGRGEDIRGFYYNPNIHPLSEYLRRKEALASVGGRLAVAISFADSEYDPVLFLRMAAFREKDRCRQCYALRLDRCAREAMRLGCGSFTTTLLYSKYQDHQAIREAGEEAARSSGVTFAYEDFRSGWEEGIRLSKQWELYRQAYCGCIYSEYDRYRKKLGASRPA
jgi:hypothetical protein